MILILMKYALKRDFTPTFQIYIYIYIYIVSCLLEINVLTCITTIYSMSVSRKCAKFQDDR